MIRFLVIIVSLIISLKVLSQNHCSDCFVLITAQNDTLIYDSEFLKKNNGNYPGKTGTLCYYSLNGSLIWKEEVVKGRRNGYYERYNNGEIVNQGTFYKGLKHGICLYYDTLNKPIIGVYKKGKLIENINCDSLSKQLEE